MAIERDYEPNYLQAGERLVIDVRGGRDEILAWETTVLEPCENDRGGYWYCDTCRMSEPHNMGIQAHAQKGHRLAWICHEHGPETVRPKVDQ